MNIQTFIGPKEYYRKLLKIAIPMALSNLLSSCMRIVDSIMVSSIGMVTAVGNAGNVIMLNDGLMWGFLSGISIFSAQFFGAKQNENFSRCFGLASVVTGIISLFWVMLVYLKGEDLLLFYLNDPEIVAHSLVYLKIYVLAYFPMWFNFCFISSYRSMHETKFPFYVSTGIALCNVAFNAFFIYVLKIGVAGAAYGTLCAELLGTAVLVFSVLHWRPPFFRDLKTALSFRSGFILPIFRKTVPIIINETLFGFGSSLFAKAYGLLGTESMDAYYISQQAFNLFTFAIWGFGAAVSVMVGARLGAGELEEARKESNYQFGAALLLGSILAISIFLLAGPLLYLYQIEDPKIYQLAKELLYVLSLKVFLRNFNYMMMSTLKAGGDSRILNLLDSGIMYAVGVTLAFASVYAGIRSIVIVVLICQMEQVVRFFFAMVRYKKGYWVRNLTTLIEKI